jgi:hypothetical protein
LLSALTTQSAKLKQLAEKNRPATRAEQSVLAKYVGWGGLKGAFPREGGSFAKGWEKIGKELRDLLGPEEYKAAANSTQNAHYTSPNHDVERGASARFRRRRRPAPFRHLVTRALLEKFRRWFEGRNRFLESKLRGAAHGYVTRQLEAASR